MPEGEFPNTSALLCIVFISLIPLAAAGLSLINTGLGRSHSAAHAMLASLCVFGTAIAVFLLCGFAWQGYRGLPAHTLIVGGKPWNWIGAQPFFLRHLPLDGSPTSLVVWLQMLSVGLCALIPLGAGLGRWRLSASCISTALLAGWTYPLFAHWVWGGGWLAQLGMNYGMGHGFVDAGGAGTIHAVGGLTALSVAWNLGPRCNKYPGGMPAAIPGHNVVLVLFGCVLTLTGWTGLNSAGAILFAGIDPGHTVLVSINTMVAAGSAGLMAVLITGIRFGRPDVSIAANGWVGGLVASSAACAFLTPALALLVGGLAGVLVTWAVEWIELRFSVDDPAGAISVHAVGGLWGLLVLGFFADLSGSSLNGSDSSARQWLAQVVGIATLLGFVLPLTYGLNRLLNLLFPQRVAIEGERQGLDLYELGAGAYPEFVTHTDEFTQR